MYGCDVFLEALAPSFTDARGGEVLQFTAASGTGEAIAALTLQTVLVKAAAVSGQVLCCKGWWYFI